MSALRLGRRDGDGQEPESDAVDNEVEKRRPMSMLRLGRRSQSAFGPDDEPAEEKRRPMSMLRLGRRDPDYQDELAAEAAGIPAKRRPMSMLRLGRRNEQQATDARDRRRSMSMLRLG
jgi:ribosomal protein L30/L7E